MQQPVQQWIGKRNLLRLFWHQSKALAAALRFGFPARRLTVIGITGTDGKTTTVGMTAHILHHMGYGVGALSTAFFQINNQITWNATQKTSPSPFIVQKFLRDLVKAGCTHAVLECSSHGLVQGRTLFTWPKIAAITNTSPEHLDYHGTMEQYRRDKGILFRMLRRGGTKVLNRDDTSFSMFERIPSKRTIRYTTKKSVVDNDDLSVSRIQAFTAVSLADLHRGEDTIPLTLPIPGMFNLENALCAIGCALAAGVGPQSSAKVLQSFTGVPGRMERIDEGQPFSVFVDFTVTPVAYEKTLKAIRSMIEPGKKILVMTGSCGDRMKEKRPLIGKICSELADVVAVTNEDPYTEDPKAIMMDVWDGIDHFQTDACLVDDRRDAMRYLLKQARSGDAVLLAGKGSDTTMWTAEGQIPWNEREIAREVLRKMEGGHR